MINGLRESFITENIQPLADAPFEWTNVRRVLVVRLRSIGDTVLTTASLIALKRFLPEAEVDILLEDWVAPVLEGFDAVDDIITIGKSNKARLKTAGEIRRKKYDVVFNLHGGTTSTFLTRATRAKHRVGFRHYQYNFFYNHLAPPALELWKQEKLHSAEQMLALLGFAGVPVSDRPKTRLAVTEKAKNSIDEKVKAENFALIHPAAAYDTKQWKTENFARVAELLHEKGLKTIAVAAKNERGVLETLKANAKVPVQIFDDLTLPEITALASKAKIFIGGDSGIAHIAAAVETPSVVIFGSSNRAHWHPWTNASFEIVFKEFRCQPCAGDFCREFDAPRCIEEISFEAVEKAIQKMVINGKW